MVLPTVTGASKGQHTESSRSPASTQAAYCANMSRDGQFAERMRNSALEVWRQTGKTGGGGLGARHCLLRGSTYLTAQPGVIAIPSMSGTLGTMICWPVPSRLASYTLPLHQKM